PTMDDATLLRYSRQIMLPQIGVEGQERLGAARALVIGLGGLGSPVAAYLAAAGFGSLELVDDDRVDLSNLQRQILHETGSIGLPKTASAAARLAALNPERSMEIFKERFADASVLSSLLWATLKWKRSNPCWQLTSEACLPAVKNRNLKTRAFILPKGKCRKP
ncbi:MAG: ThiF family adenylyltransferase, partial [Leadbetterella sp.]|nr:ThiF family adenylyltransferase [Leadbetterella sp.]